MFDQEDLNWIATTSTNLNSMVHQISRYADLARRHPGEHNYLNLLSERIDLASKTSQALFDHITTRVLSDATVRPEPIPDKAGAGSDLDVGPDVRIKNPKGNREYLLLVDDDPEVSEDAAEFLAEEGYRVIMARDGFEALKIYRAAGEQIALIILDFFLPVLDGDAVFDELRSINPNVDVVLSSGFAEQSKIAAMLTRGLRGFMPKPYTRDKMLEQVRSVLDAPRESSSARR